MDDCRECLDRRTFLSTSAGSVASILFYNYLDLTKALGAQEKLASAKSCIVLWMGGGPSHIDTFDPKPGQDTGGPTKAIDTAVKDIQISENFPKVAKILNKISLIRGMTHPEGEHQRATFLLQTGRRQVGTLEYPSVGSVVSFETASKQDVPGYVAISGNAQGPGFLGVEHYPYTIPNAKNALAELEQTAKGIHRASLLDKLNQGFDRDHASANNQKREAFYEKIKRLLDSPFRKALDLSQEKPQVVKEYTETNFGSGCLLARRLVETGVKFVQVSLGGWDTHQKNFEKVASNCKTVDPALAALVSDLDQKGLLQSTVVLWMGEFGRTPRINANDGRDHYPRAFSVAMAGGGIKGGRVVGATDAKGAMVVKDPTGVSDLLATIYGRFGIDLAKKYYTDKTGVVKITEGGMPVKALVE